MFQKIFGRKKSIATIKVPINATQKEEPSKSILIDGTGKTVEQIVSEYVQKSKNINHGLKEYAVIIKNVSNEDLDEIFKTISSKHSNH